MWKAKNAANYARNPEKCRESARKNWAKHREKRIASLRNYYANNRELYRVRAEASYQKTKLNTPWRLCLMSAKCRSKKDGTEFSLTEEWAKERWTGKCEFSGVAFSWEKRTKGPQNFAPTIDKIEPAKGYTPDNSRFVLWAVNAFKGSGNDKDMLIIVEAIHKKFY